MLPIAILIGLFGLVAFSGFAFPYSYADVSESVTFYYQSTLPIGSCPPGGALNTSPPYSTATYIAVGGPCPDTTFSGTYSGPSFTITAMAYSLNAGCEVQSSGQYFDVSVSGPLGISVGSDLQDCSVGPTIFSGTITPAPGTQLSNGETLTSTVSYGELPQSTCFTCLKAFGGSVTISGYIITVPEFPLGLIALLAIVVPAIFLIRSGKFSPSFARKA